jgi:hypothetical protein
MMEIECHRWGRTATSGVRVEGGEMNGIRDMTYTWELKRLSALLLTGTQSFCRQRQRQFGRVMGQFMGKAEVRHPTHP